MITLIISLFLPIYLALFMGEYQREEVHQFIFYLSITLVFMVLLALLLRKSLILDLIPALDNFWVKKLKEIVDRYYLIIFSFFLVLFIIASPLVGYAYLAWYILSHIIFTLVIFYSALAINYLLKKLAHYIISPEAEHKLIQMDPPRARFVSGSIILIGNFLVMAIALIWISSLWGLPINFTRVGYALYYPLINIEGISISLASFTKLIVVIVLALIISKLLLILLEKKIFPLYKFDIGVRDAISRSVHYFVLIIGFLYGLQIIGVGTSTLSFLAAFIGIGLGFGAQNIISNFISGLIIIFERPIKKGDYVVIGGIQGRIEEIRVRSTTMITKDNICLIVPNSEFVSNQVVNWSHNDPLVRIKTTVGVSYNSDVHKVKAVLLQVAKECPDVLKHPAPAVQFSAFGDNALEFNLFCWINNPMEVGPITSNLNFLIFDRFKENNIEIAYPQRDLHIRTAIPIKMEIDDKNKQP